jgi:large subunit ribosomal protein L19e
MELKIQKRLAAQILKCSQNKIVFDNSQLKEIKEAITKADIKTLIANNVIWIKPSKEVSRGRARKRTIQKRKGRRKGEGRRKGKYTARMPKKEAWKTNIRTQRKLLKELRDKEIISKKNYQMLYKKSKGGFFRSKRHIKTYIEEHGLVKTGSKK